MTRFEQGDYHDLDALNEQYAPVEIIRLASTSTLVFSFSTIYNMALLSRIYGEVESVESAQPNHLIGDGDDITAAPPTYDLSHGWGDCPAGCIFREGWTFSVENDQVTLLGHWIT